MCIIIMENKITLYISTEDKEKLKQFAQTQRLGVSAYIRNLVMKKVEEQNHAN